MRFVVPLRLPSLANLSHKHWSSLALIAREQKLATKLTMLGAGELPTPPLLVVITRVGPRRLDDDNLAAACKYVRDQIASAVGIDDGSEQYTWEYRQRSGDHAVEVEITSR